MSSFIKSWNCCDGVLIWLKWSFSVVVQFFILLRWLILSWWVSWFWWLLWVFSHFSWALGFVFGTAPLCFPPACRVKLCSCSLLDTNCMWCPSGIYCGPSPLFHKLHVILQSSVSLISVVVLTVVAPNSTLCKLCKLKWY